MSVLFYYIVFYAVNCKEDNSNENTKEDSHQNSEKENKEQPKESFFSKFKSKASTAFGYIVKALKAVKEAKWKVSFPIQFYGFDFVISLSYYKGFDFNISCKGRAKESEKKDKSKSDSKFAFG